jgi:hypothetical protein
MAKAIGHPNINRKGPAIQLKPWDEAKIRNLKWRRNQGVRKGFAYFRKGS